MDEQKSTASIAKNLHYSVHRDFQGGFIGEFDEILRGSSIRILRKAWKCGSTEAAGSSNPPAASSGRAAPSRIGRGTKPRHARSETDWIRGVGGANRRRTGRESGREACGEAGEAHREAKNRKTTGIRRKKGTERGGRRGCTRRGALCGDAESERGRLGAKKYVEFEKGDRLEMVILEGRFAIALLEGAGG